MTLARFRSPVTFGSADGLTIAIGLLLSLEGQPHAMVRAALGAALAELVGMSAGAWLADERAGLRVALANGGAAFAACLLPALPWLAWPGTAALGVSLGLVAVTACGISVLRPEKGVLAFATTFGILALAAVLCWLASLA